MIWPRLIPLLAAVAVAMAGVAMYRFTIPTTSYTPNNTNLEKETYCMRGNCTWISAEAKDFNTSQGSLLINKKQGWFYGTRDELYWTPQNALWKDGPKGVTDGKHYWQIQVIKFKGPGLHVGVTTPTLFQPGWSIRGLFFGQGRRRNGYDHLEDLQPAFRPDTLTPTLFHPGLPGWSIRGLFFGQGRRRNGYDHLEDLEPAFGPDIQPGDVVGMFVELSGSRVKVYFDINDKSLGLAFDVPLDQFISSSEAQDAMPEFYPVVQFFNEGVVKIKKSWAYLGWPSSLRRTWLNADSDGMAVWTYNNGFIDPSPTNILHLLLKNKTVTLGDYIYDNNAIRWTTSYSKQKIDISFEGSYAPGFYSKMNQFLKTEGLFWSIHQNKEILVIEDVIEGKVTYWTRTTFDPKELSTPVENLGNSWSIK